MNVGNPHQSLPSAKQDEMLHKASRLSSQILEKYRDDQRIEEQIQQELRQERLVEEQAKQGREQQRKRKALDNLCGCEVYFLANYQSNLFDFGQIRPDQNEIDFLRYNLSLKKVELKDERRPQTDFTLSHKGTPLSLEALKNKLFALLH